MSEALRYQKLEGVAKLPPWSHSFISTYERCELQAYRQYVKRDIPYEETPERAAGNRLHKAMDQRLSKRLRLPVEFHGYERYVPPLEQAEGEKHYEWKLGIREDGSACDFFASDVWGRGVLDVCIIEAPKEREWDADDAPFKLGTKAAIFDWKTGRVWEDPSELELHAVLLKAHRPQLTKITGRYLWLKTKTLSQAYDLSDTPVKLAYVRGVMERAKQNFRLGAWQANENVLCRWCAVRDCQFNKRGD